MAEFTFRLRADSTGVRDLCGNTLELSLSEQPTYAEQSILSPTGRAIGFDANKRFKIKMNKPVLTSERGDFTESFWVKFNTIPGDWCQPAFNARIGSTEYQNFRIQYSDPQVAQNTWYFVSPMGNDKVPYSINLEQWTHYAITFSKNKLRMFIDGKKYKEVDIPSGTVLYASTANQYFEVGGGTSDRNYALNGYLDDVCAIQGIALWENDFIIPKSYLSQIPNISYLSNNLIYSLKE